MAKELMTNGNTAWPHLLADITAKRDALTQVIETIRTHFVDDDTAEMSASPVVRPLRVDRNHRPKKRALTRRTNERTNERKPRARAHGGASLTTMRRTRSSPRCARRVRSVRASSRSA